MPKDPPAVAIRIEQIDGSAVVRKSATDPSGRARLAVEAERLRRAHHPGVAEVLSFHDEPTAAELTIVFVGSQSLATIGPMSVAAIVAALAAVSDTVAHLHDLGLHHGRIAADHVVMNPDGRPILVGFGIDEGDLATIDATTDVRDLGRLAHALLESCPHQPTSRAPVTSKANRATRTARAALLGLADGAAQDDPANLPSARSFATEIRRIHESFTPDLPSPSTAEGRVRAPRGLPVALAVLCVPVALLVGVSTNHGPRPTVTADAPRTGTAPPPAASDRADDPAWQTRHTEPTEPTEPSEPTEPTEPTDPTQAAPTVPEPDGTVDPAGDGGDGDDGEEGGDGAPLTVVSTTGIVEHDGRRFAVGDPGDEIAVGDFACSGRASAAVLRPVSGEVFVFATWADDTAEQEAAVATILPPGSHWRPAPADASGCAPLLADLPDGSTVPVPWPDHPATGAANPDPAAEQRSR